MQHDAYRQFIRCQTYRDAEPRYSYRAVNERGPDVYIEKIPLYAAVVLQWLNIKTSTTCCWCMVFSADTSQKGTYLYVNSECQHHVHCQCA